MTPAQRHLVVFAYLLKRPDNDWVDVVNRYFVDYYVAKTGARVTVQPYGADTCRQLGRDLAAMVKRDILTRSRTGLEGVAGMGFPRWVYTYKLKRTSPMFDVMRAQLELSEASK